ncbi:MAG: SMC-Scp complex subunit ScpB [Nitrospirae bacterium]|nr:MAG: SMC-Scp complex subunit ScpB [Nitrospirota bacterium]
MDDQALQGVLEALLYVSAEPLSLERLTQVVGGGLTKGLVYNALQRLQHAYAQAARGLQLVEVAGGFALRTKPEWAPWIGRLKKAKPAPKISRSAMETLAIIAYKQPIVRSEIEQIRGVESAGVLRTLLEQKLIRIVGRKDIPGRPILYGTTKLFLERFGLRDLNDLPPLRDFKELAQPVSPSCQADQTSTVEIHEESPPETEKADHDRIPSELAPPVSP